MVIVRRAVTVASAAKAAASGENAVNAVNAVNAASVGISLDARGETLGVEAFARMAALAPTRAEGAPGVE